MLHAWCDGSVVGGHWGSKKSAKTIPRNFIGWVIRTLEGSYVHHHSFYMGQEEWFTGNTAEELAISSVLRWLLRNGLAHEHVLIHSDSQLTVGHLQGVYECYQPTLARFVAMNKALMKQFPSVRMKWVPREENTIADRLSKALQEKFEGRQLTQEEVEALF